MPLNTKKVLWMAAALLWMVSLALPAFRLAGNSDPLPGYMCVLVGLTTIPETLFSVVGGQWDSIGSLLTSLSALGNAWFLGSMFFALAPNDGRERVLPSWLGVASLLLAAHPLLSAAGRQGMPGYMLGYFVWVLAFAIGLIATLLKDEADAGREPRLSGAFLP